MRGARQPGSRPTLGLATVLVALYVARAAVGWIAGPAYVEGSRLAGAGRYVEALPLLERGAVGENRGAALWLAAEVRLGLWSRRIAEDAPEDEAAALWRQASRDYTRALAASPASGWYRAGLGQLYHQRERVERFRQGLPLELLDQDPWNWVGRSGRIAVGLTRAAIEREPSSYVFHDQLALILLDYRLREQALEAVHRSATVQPLFGFHDYRNMTQVPPDVLDTFIDGARSALGHAPLLRPTTHRVALGKLEMRRGRHQQAVQDFLTALEQPMSALERAEAHFYLGSALRQAGRPDEALEALAEAEDHSTFFPLAIAEQAIVADERGDLERALKLYRQARRLLPRRLDLALRFAVVARRLEKWDQAEEALNWSTVAHPTDPRPRVALVETYLEQGDLSAARRALRELERSRLAAAEVERLQQVIRARQAAAHGGV